MDAGKSGNIRVLMFPWLAHGHISPFLELAKKLSKRNFQIYLCSTPVNLHPLKEKLARLNFPLIQLVDLHLPPLPDLPPHYQTTKGLPHHLLGTLENALDMASPTFANIFTRINPDLLICDIFQPWATSLAVSLNIPTVHFVTFGAISNPVELKGFKKTGVALPNISGGSDDQNGSESLSLRDRIVQCLKQSSDIMLIKSFREIEAKYIDNLSILTKKKIVPVGPLVQEPGEEDERAEITEWLNKKDPSSVVYVSFGTEYYLSKEEREELAHGLLLSQVSFIWVLRFPHGEKINVKDALPEGFAEMVGEGGLIVEDWAPQKKILEHACIGGFVSHCGWGSVIESMRFGVPIIGMPMLYDQPLNAKLVGEVGVGLEIKRGKNNRKIEREEVARVIKQVLVEKGGENVRRRARELSECILGKKDREVDQVADELVKLCGINHSQVW
ncbi:hypothetical protein Tsubulata_034593 [Turnera subulata]|uniref:Glycosyltransferase n=1 Tax=Turnera subulata TaxID=218843 RepID=A0A9Q0G5Y7_9ROSI|nr:hypothetical protein Tsubulata_034593 [Turnera subulata]